MAYDISDVVPLTVTIKTAAGTATNATTVALTIILPDGTTATPAVANPPATTGVYLYDYPTVQAGRHVATWTSTGPQAAYSDVFDVRPAAPAYIVGLADIKQQLNMTGTADDEELRAYLEAATGVIEDYLGRAVVRRSFTEEHADVNGEILLNWTPVVSLTSVATVDSETTWNIADLHVSPSGIVTTLPTSSETLQGNVAVTYTAGSPVVKANWTLAARIIVQHLWETQRGTAGSLHPGGLDTPGAGFTRFGFALPNRALELLTGGLPGV
jgi:hypothetical protein